MIKKAKEPGSILLKAVEIDANGKFWRDGTVELTAPSFAESMITGYGATAHGELGEQPNTPYLFDTPEAQSYAAVTYQVIRQMERELPNLEQLRAPEVQAKIAKRVEELMRPVQGSLDVIVSKPSVAKIIEAVASSVANNTIEIPQIVVLPTSDVTFSFRDFDLVDLDTIAPQPLSDEIVIQKMRTGERLTIARNMAVIREDRLEDYLVIHLIDFEAVDYDANSGNPPIFNGVRS